MYDRLLNIYIGLNTVNGSSRSNLFPGIMGEVKLMVVLGKKRCSGQADGR